MTNKETHTKRKLMEKLMKTGFTCLAATATFPTHAQTADKVEAHVGADFSSGYIWRGEKLDGVSIQPSASIAYKGLSLTAWGTTGFSEDDTKEIDLTLGYEYKGFSLSVTDYWTDEGIGYFHYGARNTTHVFEAQIGYDFGVLSANWYTNFAGADGVTPSGKRAYSSYLEVNAPFKLGGLEWNASIGATPWGTDYYNCKGEDSAGANGFEVCDISIEASKEIRITPSFALPLFAKITWNPSTEGAYFVAGISF